jgi:hypothetical protein
MTAAQERKVEAALEKALRAFNENAGPAGKDRRTHEFVFHMTDWYGELVSLAGLMQNPDGKSDEEWARTVFDFLAHVSGHVVAAAKIVDVKPVEFELPAVSPRTGRKTAAAR